MLQNNVSDAGWQVLRHRTQPRTVALMLEDMAAAGIEVYLPQLLTRRRPMVGRVRATKAVWVQDPLFPGYVFARGQGLMRRYGVEGRPLGGLDAKVIAALRAAESEVEGGGKRLRGLIQAKDRDHVPVEDWRAALRPGAAVEFELIGGFIAGVVTANDNGRLTLLAEFMGQASRFVVEPQAKVRAAGYSCN